MNRAEPNIDPVWFLHHAQIDRLFWLWQLDDAPHRVEYQGLIETSPELQEALDAPMPMNGLAADLPARDVLSTEGKLLCYRYV